MIWKSPTQAQTNKQRIIFLDIDGVLNTQHTLLNGDYIDGRLMQRLERLVKESGANIVISSSWADEAKKLLSDYGFKYADKIIGVTPRVRRWRGEQILDWIEENGACDYVILEDDPFDICGEIFDGINNELVVHVDFRTGLSEEDIERAISVLKWGVGKK